MRIRGLKGLKLLIILYALTVTKIMKDFSTMIATHKVIKQANCM